MTAGTAPQTAHVHGRAAYQTDTGRACPQCRAVNTNYQTRRRRQAAYGRPTTDLVDSGPVRAHLAALQAAGVGRRRVAELSGVPLVIIGRLLGNRSARPADRVRPKTAAAILAISAADQAPHALVDAAPVWRLIHGMIARGYTRTWIAGQLGARPGAGLQIHRTRVVRRQADAVRELAEQCAIRPGPSARARAEAERHGWRVDWLWEDLARGAA